VECIVIGDYAFAFHAQPRAAKELDTLIEGSPDNLDRAARALARYGAPANVVDAMRELSDTEVVYLGQPPLRTDLLRSIDGVAPSDAIRNAVAGSWDRLPIRVIALDDLIANKHAAAATRVVPTA
jgi:hypothetical protein